MISTELIVALLQLPKVGRKTAKRILGNIKYKVNDHKDLYDFMKEQATVSKLPDFTLTDIENAISKANNIFEQSERLGIKLVSYEDSLYPRQLKEIEDFPLVLSYKGNIQSLLDKPNVAVIGTRQPSEYGARLGERLAEVLAVRDFNIVSGLATGCDTAGHKGAMKGGGTTTAVLGHGLDHIYPKENKELAEEILDKNGVWISEYFVNTKAHPNFFVERDRIQAGLSQSVVVVETGIKGGTMHTVKYCEEYNRRLVCLNHPDKYLQDEKVQGNQMLIKEGRAYPVSSPEEIDMLSYLVLDDFFATHSTKQEYFSHLSEAVGEYLINGPKNISFRVRLHNDYKTHSDYSRYKKIYLTIFSKLAQEFNIHPVEPKSYNEDKDDLTVSDVEHYYQSRGSLHSGSSLQATLVRKFQHDIDLIVKMNDTADQENTELQNKKEKKDTDDSGSTDNLQFNLWQE